MKINDNILKIMIAYDKLISFIFDNDKMTLSFDDKGKLYNL